MKTMYGYGDPGGCMETQEFQKFINFADFFK